MWNDNAWKRHLELSAQAKRYGMELDWTFYAVESHRLVFVNQKTAAEFEQVFTDEQLGKIWYGSQLLASLDFINFPK